MADTAPHFEMFLLAVFACMIVYSLFTKTLDRTILTLPMIFVAIGYGLSGPVSTFGTSEELRGVTRILAEITLVLVLFVDASRVRFAGLRHDYNIPLRMLIVGMPLNILFGTLYVFGVSPGSSLAVSLLTAALLTPTDAALAQSVVSNPTVPDRLSQSINVESGLNDGLALPVILLAALMASGGINFVDPSGLAKNTLLQVVMGPIVGIAIGWIIARLLNIAIDRDWINESAKAIVFLATAFATFFASELVGGNGFISTFVAGAVFANSFRHDIHFISEFMEGTGQLLTMATFLIFGALMLPDAFAHFSMIPAMIAIGFVSLIRIAPIWISLSGTGIKPKEKFFLGWFGPRGLASILFTLIVMDEFDIPNEEELLACVSLTVLLSIVVHGVSSIPLVKYIAKNQTTVK